jgi:hypothetical protein
VMVIVLSSSTRVKPAERRKPASKNFPQQTSCLPREMKEVTSMSTPHILVMNNYR